MKLKYILLFLVLFIVYQIEIKSQNSKIISESYDYYLFDSIYKKGLGYINIDIEKAKIQLNKLEKNRNQYNDIQNAKTNFLRLRIKLYNKDKKFYENPNEKTISQGSNKIDSLLFFAKYYLKKSMPDKAIPILIWLIQNEHINDHKKILININLSEAYRQKQEYEKGISLLNSIIINKVIDKDNLAYAYNRLAALYNEWGNLSINTVDSVFKYSEKCIKLSDEISNKENLASSQNELGYQYNRKKQFEKAIILFKNAYDNFMSAKLKDNAVNTLINQSNSYLGLNLNDSAIFVLREAGKLLNIEENRNLFLRIYLQYAKVYEVSKQYKDAYEFLSLSRLMQVDFFKDRMSIQINELSAKYDLKIKEQVINEERKVNQLQKSQLFYLIILISSLFIAILILLFYFRLKRKSFFQQKEITRIENEKLKSELDYKTREIEFKSRELSQALANMIINHEFLIEIKEHFDENNFTKAKQTLNNSLNNGHQWNEFKMRFDAMYPSLYSSLKTIHPHLSETDVKLCSLLFIELKSKEIASILSISDTSVDKARQRLRKRLNLDSGANISEYLKNL